MPELIQNYLSELRKLLKGIPQTEIEPFISNCQGHLEAAADEMGELTAVQNFGSAKQIARRFKSAYSGTNQKLSVAALLCFVAAPLVLLPGALFAYKNISFFEVAAIALALAAGAIAISFWSRRSFKWQILAAGVLLAIVFPALECMLFVTIFPESGHGLVSRFEAANYISRVNREAPELATIAKELRAADQAFTFDQKYQQGAFRTANGFVVPSVKRTPAADGGVDYTLETTAAANLSQAKALWAKNQNDLSDITVKEEFARAGTVVPEELKKPLFSEYWPFFFDSFMFFLEYTLVIAALNWLFSSLGSWARRRRRLATA